MWRVITDPEGFTGLRSLGVEGSDDDNDDAHDYDDVEEEDEEDDKLIMIMGCCGRYSVMLHL